MTKRLRIKGKPNDREDTEHSRRSLQFDRSPKYGKDSFSLTVSPSSFCIFSCCHGAEDAYARIYGYFKRQLARVSVRAAMLVRLRALDVVLGRSPRPESSTDRKEAKRAKATRLAAVHVVSESGIPANRGNFGA